MAKFDYKTDWFYIYPDDEFDVEFDFTRDLGSGDSLASCTVTAVDSEGTSASIISGISISTPDVTFTVSGAEGGRTYSIKLVGTTTNGKDFTHYITCECFGVLSLNTKLADSKANSYANVAEANFYLRNKYGHDSKWDTLDLEGKKRVLIEAAKEIDAFSFVGERYYESQNLKFPRDDHEAITGNCGTPITKNSFRSSSLYSTTYGVYPTSYWKKGTVHITSGTPVHDVEQIASSNVTNGSITLVADLSATPNTNTQFVVFAPLHKHVKDAQAEQALFVVQNANIEKLQAYKGSGVRRVEIGQVEVEFERGPSPSTTSAVSPLARKLLTLWIRKQNRIGRA